MTFSEVQRLLGFTNGPERDAFLKAHGIVDGVTPIELENAHSNPVAAGDAVERSRALRADKTLGGLDVVALTREGSR